MFRGSAAAVGLGYTELTRLSKSIVGRLCSRRHRKTVYRAMGGRRLHTTTCNSRRRPARCCGSRRWQQGACARPRSSARPNSRALCNCRLVGSPAAARALRTPNAACRAFEERGSGHRAGEAACSIAQSTLRLQGRGREGPGRSTAAAPPAGQSYAPPSTRWQQIKLQRARSSNRRLARGGASPCRRQPAARRCPAGVCRGQAALLVQCRPAGAPPAWAWRPRSCRR